MTLAQVYLRLTQRRQELEANVFEYPPANWEEFQRRFGQWIELSTQINELAPTLQGEETEEGHPKS